MDKIFQSINDFSTVKKLFEAINKTTDDFLFVLDIPHDENWFFGSIDERFAVRKPGSEVNTFEEMLAVVHPADRKALCEDIERIKNGTQDAHDMNYRWINRDGEIVWISCRGRVVHDESGKPHLMIGRVSEEAVRHLYNPLTSLPNKTKLREDLKERLNGAMGVLVLLEIPELADINLSHGSSFGNQLLCEMADILEGIDPVEEVYHINYNKFAAVIGESSNEKIQEIYRQINSAVSEKCSLCAGAVPIDKRLFIDFSQLIDSANVTLQKAKQKTADCFEFFSADDIEQRISALTLLEELKESVQNDFEGFELWYQPQVRSGNYELHGVEALIRYNSKKRGKVFPDSFIPLLEQSRLIESVGMWVLDQALAQCKAWREFIPSLHVSVNFSSVQFEDHKIGGKIVDALKNAGMPGESLTVELTESVQLHQDKHFYDLIRYIKSYGVRFSIDDFGTGYSNLGYLKQLDVNEIKIDRSFVSRIEKNTYNYRLISNVIEFAKTNSIHACCEGVETAKELSMLESLQADFFQGYLFDKPCTADDITRKYIHTTSYEYKARIEAIDEINRFKEQFGTMHFEPKNILRANDIGLWIIRIDEKNNRNEMHVDDVMEQVLGITEKLSPCECYDYWYSRISHEDKEYVDNAVNVMINDKKAVQLGYRWNHPEIGQVTVRSSGIRASDESGKIVLEGYHRILTGVEGA